MAARAPRSTRKVVGVTATLAVVFLPLLFGGSTASAAEPNVDLGTATSFAVLAGSTVTNTGPTIVAGDLGVSPGTAVTGFPPGTVSDGTIHAADAVADTAQADVTTAYVDAAGRASTGAITADLAGQTLVAGVYTGPTLGLTGTLTLDAQGDPDAVFVFQAGSTLITGTGSSVSLINGASACNVTWQVGSSATLGTASTMVGTVLALTSITLDTGADVSGRVLARNGAVTLDANTISRPVCTVVPPTTTTTTSTTSTSTSTSTSTTAPTTSTTAPTTSTTTAPSTSTTLTPPTSTTSTSTTTTVPGSTTTSPPIVTTTTTSPPTSTTSTTSIPTTSTTAPSTSTSTSAPASTTSTSTTSTTQAATTSSTTAPASTSSTTLIDSGRTTVPEASSTTTAPARTPGPSTTVDTVVVEASTTVPGGATSTTVTTTSTSGGPSLPRTGSSSGSLALVGSALLALGATLLLVARRRVALRS